MSKENKKIYESPTTKGLMIDFRNYVIELVCLNVNNKIRSRFWKDQKYWGPKYRRELKGIYNLKQALGNDVFSDPLTQKAIIDIVKQDNIKCLTYKKTINRICNKIKVMKKDQWEQMKNIGFKTKKYGKHDKKNNTRFININNNERLSKILEHE